MGGFTVHYSPLQNLSSYLLVQRHGSWSAVIKRGVYDPALGVTTAPAHHPDDAATIRKWIKANPGRLTKAERVRHHDLLPAPPPSLWVKITRALRALVTGWRRPSSGTRSDQATQDA